MEDMPAAEVRVLGPVEVVGDGGVVSLAAKQTRLLAALLVADGRTCGSDELIEAVWNASSPISARNLLQVYVSQLRKVLPTEITLVTRGRGYALELAPGCLDAARFERLIGECATARRDGNPALAASLAEQALALWRGRAYGELAYEDFASAESERLEELRLVAREERLEAELALGGHVEVLGEVLALADESPDRERAHELAMLALYRSGRQTEALEHYAAVRARLREELGLEPGTALRELQRRILQQDPSLDVPADFAQAASALPVPPNALIGRERELGELAALLARRDSRLIVLTGAGGSGKTRLALEAARQAAGTFANGARLVELAPLRDPALVVPTIARAVEVSELPEEAPVEALGSDLAPLELLVVVDNAEHVRSAAPHYATLLACAPRLTFLVTSRAVLHVSGEHVFAVSPLAEDDAVDLFSQRARLLDPSFEVMASNESDIREICRRVDGLPLAVELAAARVRVLSPRALRDRLDDRLNVLTGGPRDLPARQQTLRETIAWSVDLLAEREIEVFARLAVFPAGATLEAAEAVCGADLDVLGELVDHHLLLRGDVGGEPRFRMLETMREYALVLLGEERETTELALANHFASLADELRLAAPFEREWQRLVERLDPEVDNLRAALAAALDSGDPELGLRLAGGLWRYWATRGPVAEGLEWIERALAADGPATAARACALQGGAGLAWRNGNDARARELANAAIPVAIEAESAWDERTAHMVLGVVDTKEADTKDANYPAARRHFQRAIELTEQFGVEPLIEKYNLGAVALAARDYEEALTVFDDVLEGQRRNDNIYGIGLALFALGITRYWLGDYAGSRGGFEEARAYLERVGAREHAFVLQGLAFVEVQEARFAEAAQLLGHARQVLDSYGSPEDSFDQELLVDAKAKAREALGDEAFEAAYEGGVDGEGDRRARL
jgi:predicted ATPase/DNA-binding SARP family transcriptional activator